MEEAGSDQAAATAISLPNGSSCSTTPSPSPPSFKQRWRWWLLVFFFSFCLLAGQTIATLLGRLYFDKGGNSKWMATIVQSAGFPLLIPLLLLLPAHYPNPAGPPVDSVLLHRPKTNKLKIAAVYAGLGLLIVGDNLMYSYGLLYLPVSTYSLICATQLAFNTVTSYFLNGQRFTALIVNSVVVLTFATALLGVDPASSSSSSQLPRDKFALGFVLTVGASGTLALILSLMQLTFEKVLKRNDIRTVLQMQICSNMVATVVSVIGLFASGEWKAIGGEMAGYKTGKAAYVLTLTWTAVLWQVGVGGLMGLVATVSSLFCNVISTVGLPLVPVFAVVFFGDGMDGVKVVSMLMAVWGFLSYIYQHYLDDTKAGRSPTAALASKLASDPKASSKRCW